MANREFKTITERKLVCKASRTPSNARWSQQRGSCSPPRGLGDGHCHARGWGTTEKWPRTGSLPQSWAALCQAHGGDQGEGQSRVIQTTEGNEQGWELGLYQPLNGQAWASRRVRMLYGTVMKVKGSGVRHT